MVGTGMVEHYSAAEAAAKEQMRQMLAHLSEAHREEVRQLREKVHQLSLSLQMAHESAKGPRADHCNTEPARHDIVMEPVVGPLLTREATTASRSRERQGRSPSPTLASSAVEGQVVSPKILECNTHAIYMGTKLYGGDLTRSSGSSCPSCTKDFRGSKQDVTKVGRAGSRGRPSRKHGSQIRPDEDPWKLRKAKEIQREAEACMIPAEKRMRRVMKSRTTMTSAAAGASKLAKTVESPWFDSLCAVVIVVNSVLVGLDVEWRTRHETSEPVIEIASIFCSIFFIAELVMRVLVFRGKYFCGCENLFWNWFDLLLVMFSMVEFLIEQLSASEASTSIGSAIKVVKIVRIVRVFRVFRFFKELSLLALMILDSMKSLMWALFMLAIILYCFAILFTQFATDYIKSSAGDVQAAANVHEVERQFGSVSSTLYSLLQAMLGGVSWGIASDALISIHWTTAWLFFFYIFFTMLAFLNITTGVFVDNAVETARTQRDFLVQKDLELKQRYLAEMRDMFREMDEDNSGTLSMEEIDAYFEDPRGRSYFSAIGLDAADTERLFGLLNCNVDGTVSIDEFLHGCMRLKGPARSIDVQQLLMDVRTLKMRVDDMTGSGSHAMPNTKKVGGY